MSGGWSSGSQINPTPRELAVIWCGVSASRVAGSLVEPGSVAVRVRMTVTALAEMMDKLLNRRSITSDRAKK